MSEIRILLVDDDEALRVTLVDFISRLGVMVRAVGTMCEAAAAIGAETQPFDNILTDLRLPDGSGLDVVKAARARSAETLVSIVTGFGSLETAIGAIRLGAYDYITKPFSLDEIGVQVRNMIGRVSLSKENARLSLLLQELYAQVHRLQSDRSDGAAVIQEIRSELADNSRKLEQLLRLAAAGGTRPGDPAPDRAGAHLVGRLPSHS